MRFFVKTSVFVLLFSIMTFSQELTRDQKLQKINKLNSEIKSLESEVLLPGGKDLREAEREGLQVFRLMPRERYDRKFTVQGGGSYYSFTTKSHDYQKIAQISLEQDYLKAGFAGADYGLIAGLGDVPLDDISSETTAINFLVSYKPPLTEPEIRIEQRRSRNYEIENTVYKNYLPAVVGHSYVLRAINFEYADVLVAFKIQRQDTDGSLIIFWKWLEQFAKPMLIDPKNPNEWRQALVYDLRAKGFDDVFVDASRTPITLQGTVPKGKIAEVIQLAQERLGGKPIRNQLTEK